MDKRQIHPAQPMPLNKTIKTIEIGVADTESFRVFFQDEEGHEMSPWHDIPLLSDRGQKRVNFVCLTPASTWVEHEPAADEPFNPIKCADKGDEILYFQEECVSWTLGFLPQTWAITEETAARNPQVKEKRGAPLEVMIIKSPEDKVGKVHSVKILGAFAVRDKRQQLSWKLLGVNCDASDPTAKFTSLQDIATYNPQMISEVREWLRTCHAVTPEEQNKFANSERPMGEDWAMRVVSEAHANWQFVNKGTSPRLGDGEWIQSSSNKPRTAQDYQSLWQRYIMKSADLKGQKENHGKKNGSLTRVEKKKIMDVAWIGEKASDVSEDSLDSPSVVVPTVPAVIELKSESEDGTPKLKSPSGFDKVMEKRQAFISNSHVKAHKTSKIVKFWKGLKSTFSRSSGPAKFKLSNDLPDDMGPGLTGLNFGFKSGVLTPRNFELSSKKSHDEDLKDPWASLELSKTFPNNSENGPTTKGQNSPTEAATSEESSSPTETSTIVVQVPRNRKYRRRYPNLPATAEDSAVDSWQEESPSDKFCRQNSFHLQDNGLDAQTAVALSRGAQSGPMKPRGEVVTLQLGPLVDRRSRLKDRLKNGSGSGPLAPKSGPMEPVGHSRLQALVEAELDKEKERRSTLKSAKASNLGEKPAVSETLISTAPRKQRSPEKVRFAIPEVVPEKEEVALEDPPLPSLKEKFLESSESGNSFRLQRAESLGTAEARQLSSYKVGDDLYTSDLYPPPRIPVRIPPRGGSKLSSGRPRGRTFLSEKDGGEKEGPDNFRRSMTENWRESGVEGGSPGRGKAEGNLFSIMTSSGPMIARTFDWQDRDFGRSKKPAARLARSANVGAVVVRRKGGL